MIDLTIVSAKEGDIEYTHHSTSSSVEIFVISDTEDGHGNPQKQYQSLHLWYSELEDLAKLIEKIKEK